MDGYWLRVFPTEETHLQALVILLRHKFLTAQAFGDRLGAAWAS
jgi:hypothetical protein